MRNNEGWTSLIVSSQLSHTENVLRLLQYGAEVNMHNNEGLSSLMVADSQSKTIASWDKYYAILKMLFSYDVTPSQE